TPVSRKLFTFSIQEFYNFCNFTISRKKRLRFFHPFQLPFPKTAAWFPAEFPPPERPDEVLLPPRPDAFLLKHTEWQRVPLFSPGPLFFSKIEFRLPGPAHWRRFLDRLPAKRNFCPLPGYPYSQSSRLFLRRPPEHRQHEAGFPDDPPHSGRRPGHE